MKKIILYLSFVFASFKLQAQNLLLNPSFEDTQYYIQGCEWSFPVINWKTTSNWAVQGIYDADFLSLLNDPQGNCDYSFYSLPYSGLYGYQYPRTGVSVTGIFCGDTVIAGGYFSYNIREFIMGRLSEPMQQGNKYCVEFFVNLANRDGHYLDQRLWTIFAINKFQLKFSTNPIYLPNGYDYNVGYDITLQDSLNGSLKDTLGWHRIYNYHEASGGEKHFMFGNFLNNKETKFYYETNAPDSLILPSGVASSYYFIDDASITLIPEFKINTSRDKISLYQNAVLYANVEAESITWYALPDTVNAIGMGDTLTVNPKETTQYAAKANQCRYESWDTAQITVTPTKLIGELAVFNNSTQNQFTIRYLDRAPLQMYLFNTAGQIVKAMEFSASTDVNIADLAAGVYYCRIMQGESFLLVEKIVKMN